MSYLVILKFGCFNFVGNKWVNLQIENFLFRELFIFIQFVVCCNNKFDKNVILKVFIYLGYNQSDYFNEYIYVEV